MSLTRSINLGHYKGRVYRCSQQSNWLFPPSRSVHAKTTSDLFVSEQMYTPSTHYYLIIHRCLNIGTSIVTVRAVTERDEVEFRYSPDRYATS